MRKCFSFAIVTIVMVTNMVACGGGGSGGAKSSPSSSASSANHLPSATDDTFSINKSQSLTGNIATNDVGTDDKPISYQLAANTNVYHGTLQLLSTGEFTYTPNQNFIGEENFQYQVTDKNGDKSIAHVKITMNATGDEIQWPSANSIIKKDDAMEANISAMIANMSLSEKIGQMTQAEIQSVTESDISTYHLGSVLNGGGSWPNAKHGASVSDWVNLADTFHAASISNGQHIPILWGIDAVHGNNNVTGATLFPHNIGLGATHNPDLIKAIGEATAKEVAVTGLDWVFAPTIAVVRDDRWGRTYEGYSEDPEIVRSYAAKIVEGLQGAVAQGDLFSDAHVIATAKHFIGDGGTVGGMNGGNNLATEQELLNIHAQGYLSAIGAGAQTVMASFNSWQGTKMHGSEYLLTQVLKNQMGFDGFVVSDWNGHSGITGCNSTHCPQAINAGVDMFMVPYEWRAFIANTISDVNNGLIPMSRIDDAVTRILRVKMRAGLFQKASPSLRSFANKLTEFGSFDHRALARQAVRESIVLLKNKNNILPLNRKINVLVVGDGANNIAKQCGGWCVTWQGTENTNSDFPGATSIYQGIASIVNAAGGTINYSQTGELIGTPDVVIAVYGENPYAEGAGDISQLEYQAGAKTDLAILKNISSKNIPVASVFLSGRPLWVNKELNASDAFVAAWLPGTEGTGIADVIFRKDDASINYDFKGKLSYSWPIAGNQYSLNRNDSIYNPLFAYGFGLTYQDHDVLPSNLPEDNSGNVIIDNPNQKRLVAYLPDWRGSFTTWASTIDFTRMTHLNLAFGNPRGTDHHIEIGATDTEVANIVNAAHQAGVKVLISLAGGSTESDAFATHYAPATVDALVQQIDNFVSAHNLDGVDVDVEAPDKMGDNYRIFVQKLMAQLKPKNKIITVAVAQWMQYGMDDATLKSFDFINIMSYSTYAKAQTDLDFYVKQKQVPSNRAVLGVAFYGDANGCAETTYLYKDILAKYADAWTKDKITDAGCTITYTGEDTMKKDVLLSQSYGGVMLWELSGDAAGTHSLYKIIQSNLP